MTSPNKSFFTPVQTKGCKRLGLRRNCSNLNKLAAATAIEAETATNTRCGGTTTPRLQPQSDAKVNYRNLESAKKDKDPECGNHTPATPNKSSLLPTQSVSTNCRPYRLALSKRVREKMTKKRLEFHIANEMEKEDEERKLDQQQEVNECNERAFQVLEIEASCPVSKTVQTTGIPKSRNVDKEPEEMSHDELLAVIEQSRKELKARKAHLAKVQDLQQAIDTWQIGFSTALNDLQEKIRPPVDKKTLLEQLHIPKEMIKYVKE